MLATDWAPWVLEMSKPSMRRGTACRDSAAASSRLAPNVRSCTTCSRALRFSSASFAFCSAFSTSFSLSPRLGTVRVTAPPRRSLSHSSMIAGSVNACAMTSRAGTRS